MLVTIGNSEFRNLLICWPEQAIRILYELHYDALLIISLRITNDVIVSEDIVRQLFTNMWLHHKKPCNSNEPIQREIVRMVRQRSLQFRMLNQGAVKLAGTRRGDDHRVKDGSHSARYIGEESDDHGFLLRNVPGLPDKYALDDNFYHGLRQIEYNVLQKRNDSRRLANAIRHAVVILLAVISSIAVTFFMANSWEESPEHGQGQISRGCRDTKAESYL
jgi:hypothetical protein